MAASRLKRIALTLLKPKVGIPLGIALALLAAPFIYRSSRLAGLPDMGDPFDVEVFGTVEIDPSENAFVAYEKAVAVLVPFSGPAGDLDQALEDGWPAASEPVRKWVASNRTALAAWRTGTGKPDALYHQPKTLDVQVLLPITQELRTFARLARLEGSRLEETGDVDGAFAWYRAMFRSSRHSGKHGCMIERLVGIAIHAMAAEAIVHWSRSPVVGESQLQHAFDAVTADFQLTAATSTAYKCEYLIYRNTLATMDAATLAVLGAPLPSSSRGRALGVRALLFLQNEPEVSRRIVQQVVANWLPEVDKPRHARPPVTASPFGLFDVPPPTGSSRLPAADIERFIERSFLARHIMPAVGRFDMAVWREQARQAALRMALAAQIHDRRHGEFPAKAEALVGNILDELPADPFGKKGETMHYRRDGARAIVWSVGENGTDDGGVFPEDPRKGDVGYEITAPGAGEEAAADSAATGDGP